jgi:hypothetical protein
MNPGKPANTIVSRIAELVGQPPGPASGSTVLVQTLGEVVHKRTRSVQPRTNGEVDRSSGFSRTLEQVQPWEHSQTVAAEGFAAFPALLHP